MAGSVAAVALATTVASCSRSSAIPVREAGPTAVGRTTPAPTPSVRPAATTTNHARPGTPKAIVREARYLAHDFMRLRGPAHAVWVRTTLARWEHLDSDGDGTRSARATYVVALLSPTRMTCELCPSVQLRPPGGRYLYVAIPVHGPGESEMALPRGRFDLAAAGRVRVAFDSIR